MTQITVNIGTKTYDFTYQAVNAISFAKNAVEAQQQTETVTITLVKVPDPEV